MLINSFELNDHEVILKPFFETFRDEIYVKFNNQLYLETKRAYDMAMKKEPDGYRFVVSDQNVQSDIYRNFYYVKISTDKEAVNYQFDGEMFVGKFIHKDLNVCTARLSSEISIKWQATYSLIMVNDNAGKAKFTPRVSCKILSSNIFQNKNTCADVWGDAVNDILRRYRTLFDEVAGSFEGLISNACQKATQQLEMQK